MPLKTVCSILTLFAFLVIESQPNLIPHVLAPSLYRAEKVTVFRIDAADYESSPAASAGSPQGDNVISDPQGADKLGVRPLSVEQSRFLGYKIVALAVVNEPSEIVDLVRKMERSMTGDINPAKGFIPEYGLRFTTGKDSVDLLVSFQCLQMSWERTEGRVLYLITPGEFRSLMDEMCETKTVIAK